MKHTLIVLSILASSIAAQAQEVTLKYKWKPNTAYRFKCTQKDEVKMSGSPGAGMPGMPDMGGMGGMMSMGGNMVYNTISAFTLKVNTVQADGSAAGMFFLENFRVTDGSGKALASLAGIPKMALKAPFQVDELGNFTFSQIPVLIIGENRTVLTVLSVEGEEKACGEAAGEGESVKVYAEFTKGGGLKAGYTVTTVNKPKAKAIAIGEDDEVIDLIPTDFLDMLVLPEGPVQEGQTQELTAGGMETQFKVASLKGNMAVLNTYFGARVSAQETKAEAEKMAGDDLGDDEEVPRMAQQSQGQVTVNFDRQAGMFKGMSGKVNDAMDMMGMQVQHTGTFSMTPVP